MTTTEETEARDQLYSRLSDMTDFLGALSEDNPDAETEEQGPVYDYGLEWALDSRSYRDETLTYRHVISTGGPHEEFLVTFDIGTEECTGVTFVSLPWFGRVDVELTGDDETTAKDFYTTFFAGSVSVDAV